MELSDIVPILVAGNVGGLYKPKWKGGMRPLGEHRRVFGYLLANWDDSEQIPSMRDVIIKIAELPQNR